MSDLGQQSLGSTQPPFRKGFPLSGSDPFWVLNLYRGVCFTLPRLETPCPAFQWGKAVQRRKGVLEWFLFAAWDESDLAATKSLARNAREHADPFS